MLLRTNQHQECCPKEATTQASRRQNTSARAQVRLVSFHPREKKNIYVVFCAVPSIPGDEFCAPDLQNHTII